MEKIKCNISEEDIKKFPLGNGIYKYNIVKKTVIYYSYSSNLTKEDNKNLNQNEIFIEKYEKNVYKIKNDL